MNAARLAALSATALALAACGSSGGSGTPTTTRSTTTPTTQPTTAPPTNPAKPKPKPTGPVQLRITVGPKGVPGGPKQLSVQQGTKAVLLVHSALADEVHLHGYDLSQDVAAGGTTRIRFTATIPGRFEVELESRKLPIAEVEVTP